MIILVSAIGFYSMERNLTHENELADQAKLISNELIRLSTVQGETQVRFGFGTDYPSNIRLRETVGGLLYHVQVTPTTVRVEQDGISFSEKLLQPVHLWYPSKEEYDKTSLEEKQQENPELELTSNQDFTALRISITVDNLSEYHTFVYVSG